MKIGIMQPYLFPYIGYFQLINAVDKFVLLDDVNYINRGWINRNRILVNGEAQLLTIPLQDASQNKLIKDIDIHFDIHWKEKLLKTIAFSYKKAPYFNEVFPMIEAIIGYEEHNLSLYIHNSLIQICEYVGIITMIEPSSSKYLNGHLKADDKIIDICVQEKALHYINPIGGTELYDELKFLNFEIKLNFIKSEMIYYKQFKNDFVPWLSILDVLMFNSKLQTNEMLTKFLLL